MKLVDALRRPRAPDPPGVIPAWLPSSWKAAGWMAAAAVVYFLWLWSLDAARDQARALHVTHAGTWSGDLQFWFPVIIGFAVIAVAVPFVAKIVIPAFVSLRWSEREQRWPKLWLGALVIAASAVIISGSISVQTDTRLERGREAAVTEQEAAQDRAGASTRVARLEQELATLTAEGDDSPNSQARAARGGVAYQEAMIAAARAAGDQVLVARRQADLAPAQRADALRAEIETLQTRLDSAPVDAAVAARVVNPVEGAMVAFVDQLTAWRAVLLAIFIDIVALLAPWIGMRLEQARNRQLAEGGSRAEGAAPAGGGGVVDEGLMIPDLRGQPFEAEGYDTPKRVIDSETGEEMVRVRGSYRRRPRRQPKMQPSSDGVTEIEQGAVSESDLRVPPTPGPGPSPEPPGPASDAALQEDAAPEAPDDQDALLRRFGLEPQSTETALPDGEGVLVTGDSSAAQARQSGP